MVLNHKYVDVYLFYLLLLLLLVLLVALLYYSLKVIIP
jgi:hypothetical protein